MLNRLKYALRDRAAQWWRDRRFARIGAELEHIWASRRALDEHERRLMRAHQRLQAEDLNAKTPTCRGRHGY